MAVLHVYTAALCHCDGVGTRTNNDRINKAADTNESS